MIKIIDNIAKLDTKNTSMLIDVSSTIDYVYYGSKIKDEAISKYVKHQDRYVLSCFGDYDFREPSLKVINTTSSFTNRFKFVSYELLDEVKLDTVLPLARNRNEVLKLNFIDKENDLSFSIYYSVFYKSNVISTISVLTNNNKQEILVNKMPSLQFELTNTYGVDVTTFTGTWANERNKNTTHIDTNLFINQSISGASSSLANPLVFFNDDKYHYGVNLIYSGNHKTSFEAYYYREKKEKKYRVITGINDFMFSYRLASNESFISPEAIISVAKNDDDLSYNFHDFVLNHIIRKEFNNKLRPVLVNNWEGTYFNFTGEKIKEMAIDGKNLGAELFVLDDGWFGHRDNDFSSLGDWYDYKKKTGGIDKLANAIKDLGIHFGIWMEPEMISRDSDLFKTHPEYAMQIPNMEASESRNQLILDLVNPAVKEYVINCIKNTIKLTNPYYLKWDYNRDFMDVYSSYCLPSEYFHKFILALYEINGEIVKEFPNLLVEGCASGGDRFDLGILYYYPQIWCSDNTDPSYRIKIQSATSYGYPQSTMGAHVSVSPNHWTKNTSTIQTRFNVAIGGDLGYELDTTKLNQSEKEIVKDQIKFYKENRRLLQYGKYTRLGDPFNSNVGGFVITSKEKGIMVVTTFDLKSNDQIIIKGLNPKYEYEMVSKSNKIELVIKNGYSLNVLDLIEKSEKSNKSHCVYSNLFILKRIK